MPKRWIPDRVLITRSARDHAHGRAMAERADALGIRVLELDGDRLIGLRGGDDRETYRRAKGTLAVVNAPPSSRRLQPIPPSADFRLDLARGCPAHCQYCYLAGSLPGPPVTRAYADLEGILGTVPAYIGHGRVTSGSAARAGEGTTFEASCYTDPLALEHLTGSLARTIEAFGARRDAVLRFTTKYDDIDALLGIAHGRRTRARFSVNVPAVERFEGGTARVAERLKALRRMALAGYPVGLTIAPIMPVDGWETAYDDLLATAGVAVAGVAHLDLTLELITHRFTDTSKGVLQTWYPGGALEMDESARAVKRTKFGGTKYVYPRSRMTDIREVVSAAAARHVPEGRILYFT